MKNIILLVTLLLSLYTQLNAQITLIPDATFEQALINQGIDSDGLVNGQILNTDAASVTKLSLSTPIQSLEGLEAFINMDSFICSNSLVDTLNLSNLPRLKHAYFGDAPLRHFIAKNSDSLSNLRLNNNPMLVNLEVDSLSALEVFSFSHNTQLVNLTLTNCPSLIGIGGTGNNSLDTLDLSTVPSVRSIVLRSNQLVALDLTNCSNLDYLDIQDNNLLALNVLNCTSLDTLNCSENQIGGLDLSNNLDLKHIICNENQLATLFLANSPNLSHLYCHDNLLSTLDLSNNTNLDVLTCGQNLLSSLNLNNNTQITTLNCSNNQIAALNLGALTNLRILNCNNNLLHRLNLTQNTSLTQLWCEFNQLEEVDLSQNTSLSFLFITNNSLRKLILGTPIFNMNANHNPPYLTICLPSIPFMRNWNIDANTVLTTNCFPTAVEGQVVTDANYNCLLDNTEYLGTTALIQFASNTDTVYVHPTDSLGTYKAYLDTGTYTVTVQTQFPYWQSCTPSQTVVVDTNYNIQILDWVLEPIINCPLMTVDLSAPFLRMTGGGSAYTVSYCNQGTEPAYNAYVEVDLDVDLNFISSSIPVTSTTGSIYRFDLDTVEAGVCGSFEIQVIVDTSSIFAQTHCTQAHIYPDSICTPVANKPIVDGRAVCQNDTILFRIENKGVNMLQPQNYTVIQDDIAMRIGTVQLGAGQSTVIAQAALPGKTYRMEVEQVPNFPILLGDPIFSMAIEGCQPLANGLFNTGFITQFSNGLAQPFEAIDCQQNIASYDPNDKAAQPVGYGAQHYIDTNTAIDYKIRFQNTGTDTAFNITIIDTLSPYVDATTLQLGASSHNYSWTIASGNILRVDFANIMLPDSNVNEPLSNGFFRYRIAQKPNNAIGTLIENQAAIYFDYNPPIFTNTTFHTVGEEFVPEMLVSVDEVASEELNIIIFLNPFEQQTTLKIEEGEFEVLEIEVYDMVGRQMQYLQTFDTNQITLQRGNLNQGIYIYRLIGDGVLLGTGKIQAKN